MENCVFANGRKCNVLSSKKCKKCTFRKTAKELEAGRELAQKRIESLPTDQQTAIMRKYYCLRRDSEVGE